MEEEAIFEIEFNKKCKQWNLESLFQKNPNLFEKLEGSEKKWLKNREKNYKEWGMEPFMQKILAFIKTIDPEFDIDE